MPSVDHPLTDLEVLDLTGSVGLQETKTSHPGEAQRRKEHASQRSCANTVGRGQRGLCAPLGRTRARFATSEEDVDVICSTHMVHRDYKRSGFCHLRASVRMRDVGYACPQSLWLQRRTDRSDRHCGAAKEGEDHAAWRCDRHQDFLRKGGGRREGGRVPGQGGEGSLSGVGSRDVGGRGGTAEQGGRT
eukprot:7589-Hanusia_phi.AAC.1